MKASIKFGNILYATGIIAHGCNAQGAMGSGLAKSIRAEWPQVFDDYSDYVHFKQRTGEGYMGDIIPSVINKPDFVIMNCITQEFFGHDVSTKYVSYKAIDLAFRRIYEWIRDQKTADANFNPVLNYPLIGAGLANGDWSIISSIIDNVALEEDPHDLVKRVLWIKE